MAHILTVGAATTRLWSVSSAVEKTALWTCGYPSDVTMASKVHHMYDYQSISDPSAESESYSLGIARTHMIQMAEVWP